MFLLYKIFYKNVCYQIVLKKKKEKETILCYTDNDNNEKYKKYHIKISKINLTIENIYLFL